MWFYWSCYCQMVALQRCLGYKVSALVVDDEQRGAKIGSQLLNFAENYAKAQGCDKIELTSGLHRRQSGAHKFYRNHGYQSDLTQYFMKKLS
ncbi:MAG: N-acetyltransferase [Neisseriales bacterium]|nr:MAG: N-acetyltransferase [Neisseriales bacterium]